MAGAYSALVSVMTIMNNLKLHPHPPISLHPQQAESLTQHLNFLEEFLQSYDQTLPYSIEADPFETRIADAAYAAEDAIESHIADRILSNTEGSDAAEDAIEGKGWFRWMCCRDPNKDDLFCHSPARGKGIISSSNASLYEALEKVIQEMEFIQKEAMEIKQTMAVVVQHQPMPLYPLRSSSVAEKSIMVGADDLLLQMKEKLVSDRHVLQIIPIVGMGGTGKTTLAMNIYQDRLIKEHFPIRALATISQEYSIPQILVELLKGLNKEDKQLSDDELGDILYKHLFGRKYLIVMDDMWSIQAWDGIRRFLPDNKNGSRVVITTRLSNLASHLPNSSSLEMKLLDEASSWELLSKTVFRGEDCPLELEEIGKEIGKSCKGLPLSIVVVGGFLAKSKRTREFWKYVEENLSIIVNLEDYERCFKILHMSYKQLPIYLKPCFLYMGVFPEDDVIRISKLVKLWVAEGFLKPVSGGSTLEEIARAYLKDLADRNMVLIRKMSSVTGNIQWCNIHDLLRDLCLREAEKERFYTLTSQGIVNGQRRIVINNTMSKNELINALPSMSPVRSLFWTLEGEELPTSNLRLLRVLHSSWYASTPCKKIVETVHQFVNSRFLQFSNHTELELPLSIWKFWNLQTLVVSGFRERVNAPTDIWYMPHVRHLKFVYDIGLPDPPNDQDGIVLGNLQTMAGARNFKCSDQVVKRIPNLKILKSQYVEWSLDEACLTNLNRLEKLESLACKIYRGMNSSGTVSLSSQINFPDSLKKLCLTIRQSEYWEKELLDKIGSLPFLQKLKLQNGRFKDGQWETTEGQFRSLKFLYLQFCKNLQVWTIESSHFPCLTNLCLNVPDLEEFPLDFAEVSTLRLIDVINECSYSAVESLERILVENEELYGEADLQISIRGRKIALEHLRGPNFRI